MTSEGEASVNFEHSWGDGVAVMSYFNAIHADGNDNPAVDSPNVATAEPQVTKLGEHNQQSKHLELLALCPQYVGVHKTLSCQFILPIYSIFNLIDCLHDICC